MRKAVTAPSWRRHRGLFWFGRSAAMSSPEKAFHETESPQLPSHRWRRRHHDASPGRPAAPSRRSRGRPLRQSRERSRRHLDLPAGFQYRILEERGDTMSDGLSVPGAPDGMACFQDPNSNNWILMRNHELSGGSGGVTRVVIDPSTIMRVSSNRVPSERAATAPEARAPGAGSAVKRTAAAARFFCVTSRRPTRSPRTASMATVSSITRPYASTRSPTRRTSPKMPEAARCTASCLTTLRTLSWARCRR